MNDEKYDVNLLAYDPIENGYLEIVSVDFFRSQLSPNIISFLVFDFLFDFSRLNAGRRRQFCVEFNE